MKMKEVMEEYHIGRKALLLYENKGLIAPVRNKSGYREYDEEDIENLKKIILLRKVDISIEEINNILHNDKQWVEAKEKEYVKQIELLETKKEHLKTIANAIQYSEEMEKVYSRVEEVFDEAEDDTIIRFDSFLAFIILWYTAITIALNFKDIHFIILSVILGLQFLLIYFKRIKPPYIPKIIIDLIPVLLVIIGIIGVFVSIYIEKSGNLLIMPIFVYSIQMIIFGICLEKRIIDYLLKYVNLFDLLFIGIIIVGISIVIRVYSYITISYFLLIIGFIFIFLYTFLKKYV